MSGSDDAQWAVVEWLCGLLAEDPVLASGTVLPYPPGNHQRDNEYVFCSGFGSDFEPGPSASGPLIHDDVLSIDLVLTTGNRGTVQDALARIAEMMRAVYRTICDLAPEDLPETDEWILDEIRPSSTRTTPYQSDDPYAQATYTVVAEIRMTGGNR